MPSGFRFVTFSNVDDMRSAKVKREVRKHVMEDIGMARRRGRPQPVVLAVREPCRNPKPLCTAGKSDAANIDCPETYNEALYDPCVRAMSCRMDAFSSAVIPIDDVASGLLKYFIYYSTKFPQNFTFTPDISGVLQTALRDELMINGILSAAASRMQYMPGNTPMPCKVRALSCTQNCLTLLRRQLLANAAPSRQAVEEMVDSVLYMVAAAFYRSDLESAEIHMRAAWSICQLCGGLHGLQDRRVLVRLLSLDDLLACLYLRPGAFACSYDPGPLASQDPSAVKMAQRAQDCTAAALLAEGEDVLPEPLKVLASEIVECDSVRHAVTMVATGISIQAAELRHWWVLRTLSIRNRLLTFAASGDVAFTVKLALLIWTLLPPSDARQMQTARELSSHLKRVLERSDRPRWAGHEALRLWCHIVGFFGSGDGAHNPWFVTEIKGLITVHEALLGFTLTAGLLQELLDFQKRYLFRVFVLEQKTEALVTQLLSGPACGRICAKGP